MARGIKGRVYAAIKSDAVIGDANNLNIKELVLSLAISIPENREIKDSPKTAIPGARSFNGYSSLGMFDCIAVRRKSRTMEILFQEEFNLSLIYSRMFRIANANVSYVGSLSPHRI